MNIGRRLKKLETDNTGEEPLVVLFRTFYEAKDGSIADTIARASIWWGKRGGASVTKLQSETLEEFQTRLDGYADLTWQEAQQTDGLSIKGRTVK